MRFTFSRRNQTVDNYEIDLRTLPVVHEDKRNRKTGIFLMVFAAFWGGLPTLALILSILSGNFEPGLLFILLFTIIGTVLFIVGLKLATTRRVIEISGSKVRFDQRSIFGATLWDEPLSRFQGIRSRSEYHSGGENSASYTSYILELYHPDRKKRITLYESRSSEGLRNRHETYCRQLGLPALEGDDDTSLTVRDVDDFGKSVQELAREGRVKVDFDPTQPPPSGIQLAPEDGQLRIILPRSRIQWAGPLIGGGVAGVFTVVGFIMKEAPVFIGIIGLVVLLAIVAGLIWTVITRQVLAVAPDALHVATLTPWGETKGFTIDAAEIQTIRVGRVVQNQGPVALLVGEDDMPTAIGPGMPKASLEWLHNCLLAVIARGA